MGTVGIKYIFNIIKENTTLKYLEWSKYFDRKDTYRFKYV